MLQCEMDCPGHSGQIRIRLPTPFLFVDLGHDYPNQTFTVIIWENDLDRFNPPPESWQGQRICATGRIKLHKGTPEIIAYDPGQIQAEK